MTCRKAATIILNIWNSFQDFDANPKESIEGNSAFDIAMKMAYDVLMEKAAEDGEMYIACAAVQYKDFSTSKIMTHCGKRHIEIYRDIYRKGHIKDFKKWHQDGFMILDENKQMFFATKQETIKYAQEKGLPVFTSVNELW